MSLFRIALANIRFAESPSEAITLAENAISQASGEGAGLVCFPECFIPGYRAPGRPLPPPDPQFLRHAWDAIAAAAAKGNLAVVIGTERVDDMNGHALVASALVVDRDGTALGFQDKVQLDLSEECTYTSGSRRKVFRTGPLTFGVAICHEGWRYPETFRWAVRRGAQIVFHPHFHEAEPGSYRPATFADPANSFHEKAVLCRAAESTCYVATVNYASAGSPTTSAVIRPDGTVLCYQPYGEEGLLIADIDLRAATGLLARRYKDQSICLLHAIQQLLSSNLERISKARAVLHVIREDGGYRWAGLYDVDLQRGLVSNIAWSGPSAPEHPIFRTHRDSRRALSPISGR
jgi:predicted amidohydrolase